MRTTPRLDIGFCLISFLCTPQDSSKSRLCILLEFCAVKNCATAVAKPLLLLQPLIIPMLVAATYTRAQDMYTRKLNQVQCRK